MIRPHHRDPRLRVRLAAAALALVAWAPSATAQPRPAVEPVAAQPGWTLTPSLIISTSHDDNVLLRENADNPAGDVANVVNPRAALDFQGRRGQFSAAYDGALLLFREFDTLRSYDQRGSVRVSRRLSPRMSLFAANVAAAAPTTEALQLAGVPFARTGTSFDDLSGGIELAFTKRTSMNATARFQWVQFDEARPVDLVLRGGHSQGGSLTLRHLLSARTTFISDYSLHRAIVANGEAGFDVQSGSVGFERALSERVQVLGSVGLSHLGVSMFAPPRTGANYRAGLTTRLRSAALDVAYSRAFVPSFGFGGTMQNEDFSAQVRVSLSRRVYTRTAISWRRNEPLIPGELSLRSRWVQAVAGYTLQPWARVEAFYGALAQAIDRPGGMLDRTRIGFQIVTSQPARIH